ncbi:class I SAM-dependent methyltransferase [Guyparkeria halophila]|uniref:Ribosomal RNA small subunit methyltransferase J n=1 Tax=Guyparkeria halophila TaxID=47960 RepID=A0ABZ0Z182_9GAMM|nr:class I SAM-dependent methyltransferase [Guyparkeria halophila]WQH17171.1 class I SAM-dependent methyltransferase [Guyparkeria halophila]
MVIGQLALAPLPVVACRPEGGSSAAVRLQAFAEEWGLDWVDAAGDEPARFTLALENGRIGLVPPLDRPDLGTHPLVIDFAADPRFARPLARKDALARATGWKAGYRPPVVDLTTGLGRDAWALASGGCEVTAVERHPVVWLLLTDALERATAQPALAAVAARIHPVFGDVLGEHPPALAGDRNTVWHLDPMFPERKKSALVKRPMRIFHQLVGEDPDAEALFAWARRQPGARWVVKRPPGAPTIDASAPDIEYRSGRLRFDCYLAASPNS